MTATSASDTGWPEYDAQDDLLRLQAMVQGVDLLFSELPFEPSPAYNAVAVLLTVLDGQFEAAILRANNADRMQRARA